VIMMLREQAAIRRPIDCFVGMAIDAYRERGTNGFGNGIGRKRERIATFTPSDRYAAD
jgi:hypothetical protein